MDPTPTTHLDDLSLSRLLDGDFSPAEAASARAHLASCADCSRRYQGLERVVGGLRALPVVAPPRDFTIGPRRLEQPAPFPLWQWYGRLRVASGALAAAFVLLLAGSLLLPGSPSVQTTARQAAPAAGGEAPAVLSSKQESAPRAASAPAPTSAPAAAAAVPAPAADAAAQARPAGAPQPAASPQPAPAPQATAAAQAPAAPQPTTVPLPPPAPQPAAAQPGSTPEGTWPGGGVVRVAAVVAGVALLATVVALVLVRRRLNVVEGSR